MRRGAVAAADSITTRIKSHNRALLLHLPRGSIQMWAQVRKVKQRKERKESKDCKEIFICHDCKERCNHDI